MLLAATATSAAFTAAAAEVRATDTPFHVTSGDRCDHGSSEGVLTWDGVLPAGVWVTGSVRDGGPDSICADDGLLTRVTFTGLSRGQEIDRSEHTVDNGTEEFRFLLGDEPVIGPGPLDEVVVRICRFPARAPDPGLGYCGEPRSYPR
ncbi:hypothetical protein [Streptomyces profundus]|uniref:hypothetical protein n=1 Tax=Streptomyces profundus TaxID=2867410 RepID=UPI001D160B22|nr:hypothetical protein [Streptomyces sp. MA3_2.13]UED86458.1 hypothetical protein K4G22_21550 [Streptomyces sp. MA3_2.13]